MKTKVKTGFLRKQYTEEISKVSDFFLVKFVNNNNEYNHSKPKFHLEMSLFF